MPLHILFQAKQVAGKSYFKSQFIFTKLNLHMKNVNHADAYKLYGQGS